MIKSNNNSQMWFTDFVIGMMIFSFVLIGYYSYTESISNHDLTILNDLISDSGSLSSSLLMGGFPDSWDNTTVQSIGITDGNQRINSTKFVNFDSLNYNRTKKLFGTVYNYFIFFTSDNGSMINVEGVCGIGSPDVNATYNIRSAYYYDNSADSFLKNFMMGSLDADVYSAESGYPDFDSLISSIDSYSFIVIEHPLLSTSVFNNNKAAIEDFVKNRGLLMLSGEITSGQGKEMLGVKFYKKSGQSESDRNSTVVVHDDFLSVEAGENIIFRQAYYAENQSDASNFTDIARFNADNKTAISRWQYGNGSAFYFSDFDVSYFDGDFVDEVEEAIKKWGKFECSPISLNNTQYKKLVKMERLMIYNSKPVKMALYLWQ